MMACSVVLWVNDDLLQCRLEQQELHGARSAVAELWTLLAPSEQPATPASAVPPAVEMQQALQQHSLMHTSSFSEQTDLASLHTTSM